MSSYNGNDSNNPFARRESAHPFARAERRLHQYVVGKSKARCDTDSRGFSTPRGASPERLVLDASNGFIPLWDENVTLNWRFDEGSMGYFANPEGAKQAFRSLLAQALLGWGNAVPVRFSETNDVWDFEITMRNANDCDGGGCVLAAAFFPDAGRHALEIYPAMLEQSTEEMIETLAHEVGHIFGLRHFFADVAETAWPVEIFGTHKRFTIMNYGSDSKLTDDDRKDLSALYEAVWSGKLTKVNGTPIRKVRPYHSINCNC